MKVTWSNIIGKTIIVGLTYADSEDNVIERKQFYGRIINADCKKGISVLIDNTKDTFNLPPDLDSVQIASHGEYRLNSTGEVIVNTDLVSTWYIKEPK